MIAHAVLSFFFILRHPLPLTRSDLPLESMGALPHANRKATTKPGRDILKSFAMKDPGVLLARMGVENEPLLQGKRRWTGMNMSLHSRSIRSFLDLRAARQK